MSQVVYTELEGQPLRWEYKGTVPMEARQEAVRQGVSFSVSQTVSDLRTGSTGSDNQVYGGNMVGQIMKWGTSASKISTIKLYGRRVGSSPNPLFVELRKAELSNANHTTNLRYDTPVSDTYVLKQSFMLRYPTYLGQNIVFGKIVFNAKRVGSPSDLVVKVVRVADNTIMASQTIPASSINTTTFTPLTIDFSLSLLDKTIADTSLLFETAGDDSNYYIITGVENRTTFSTSITNSTFRQLAPLGLSSGTALIINDVYVKGSATLKRSDGTVIASYSSTYKTTQNIFSLQPAECLTIENTTSSGGVTYVFYHNLYVLSLTGVNYDYNSETKTIANGQTLTFARKATSLPAGKYVIIATITGIATLSAGNIRLKINATQVASNKVFTLGAPVNIVYAADLAANPTIEVEIYNNSGSSLTPNVSWVAFQVSDYAYVDPNPVTVGTTETTVASVNTAFPSGSEVMVIASTENANNDYTWRIKMNNSNAALQNYGLSMRHYKTDTANASFQVTCQLSSGSASVAAKLVVFSFPHSKIYRGGAVPIEIYSKALTPSDTVLASGSISSSSVGISNAWISIDLGSPVGLRPNEYYAAVVYTIGGDASNYYAIQNSGNVAAYGTTHETFTSSTSAGSTWSVDSGKDLSITFSGYNFTRIYNNTISNNIMSPLGKVLVSLQVKAQTSTGTMEFMGFDDHTLTCSPVSSTASSQTLITVLEPDAPRLRDVASSSTLNWEIWAAGTGLATAAYTQRHTYYTKNPITPRDFGFSELYLVADEIGPQGLLILNDNEAAVLYNSSTTQTRLDTYELFRIPVSKAEVIQEPSSGKIVLYLIGVT